MASPSDVSRTPVIIVNDDGAAKLNPLASNGELNDDVSTEGYSSEIEMVDSQGLELQPTDSLQNRHATIDRDRGQLIEVDPAPLQQFARRSTLSDHGCQTNEMRGEPEVVCLGVSRIRRAPGPSEAAAPSRRGEGADARRCVSLSSESAVHHVGENNRSRRPLRFSEADCVNLVHDEGPDADDADDSTCISDSDGSDLEIIGGRPCLGRLYPGAAINRAADAACLRRNITPQLPLLNVTSCPFGNFRLIAGKVVELADGSFIRITEIIGCSDHADHVRLRGWRYRRTRELSGGLAKRRNELCMTLDVVEDDDRGPFQQGVEEVHLSEVVRIRRLVMTNRDYPELSYEQTVPNRSSLGNDEICRELVLVCRWKWITYYETEDHRRKKSEPEVAVSRITEDEVDMALRLAEGSKVSDDELRRRWRGDRATARSPAAPQPTIDLCSDSHESGSERIEAPTFEDVPGSPSTSFGGLSTLIRGRAMRGVESSFKRTVHVDLTAPEPEASGPDTEGYVMLSAPQSPSLEAVDRTEQRRGNGPTASQESAPTMGFTARTADDKRSTNAIETQQNQLVPTPTAITAQAKATSYTLLQLPAQASSHDENGPSLILHSTTKSQGPDPATAAIPTKIRPSGDLEMIREDARIPKQTRVVPSQRPTPSTSRSPSAKGASKPRTRNTGAALHRLGFDADRQSRDAPRYLFGDCFCGAGGMSSAAEQAGLEVAYGFDRDSVATQSYRLNHPRARCYTAAVHNFLVLQGEDFQVDILHLSPPCQPFSQAHTIPGKDDEENEAALFAIAELLRKARPRLATFEETAGLVSRHPNFFNQVIDMLTSNGFSVRYKVVNFAEYSLAQARKRVFIVASCPGEALPRFPRPTHSDDPVKCATRDLAPLTTVYQAIGFLEPGHPNHDLERAARLKVEGQPYDGDAPLPRCITTSGGQNYHPSGTRQFTHREFACLQGFPPFYMFVAPRVMRQIGNAVPPSVGKVFLDEFRQALMRSDGLL